MKPTVVMLLSDKRSGSTFFEREICRHPGVQHVSYTPHSYNETHYWTAATSVLYGSSEDFPGGNRPGSYGSARLARKILIKTIKGNIPDFEVPADDEELIFDGWEAICARYARPVFFEKTPHHLHHQAAINLLLKWSSRSSLQLRIVGLVRNPMAVLYSAQKLFHSKPEERQYSWKHAGENLLRLKERLQPDRFRLFRYEDLTQHPEIQFRNLCDFIGIEFHPEIGAGVHSESLAKWRDDPAFYFHPDPEIVEFSNAFGYLADELANPKTREPAIMENVHAEVIRKAGRNKSRIFNLWKRAMHRFSSSGGM